MSVKTCLLVTDDPDDHHTFSEALAEISENAIVLNVLDSEKALKLLKAKKHSPDYMFLDLSMNGIRINSFLKTIRTDEDLKHLPTVVYGEQSALDQIGHYDNIVFIDEDYEYSELKNFLQEFIKL